MSEPVTDTERLDFIEARKSERGSWELTLFPGGDVILSSLNTLRRCFPTAREAIDAAILKERENRK